MSEHAYPKNAEQMPIHQDDEAEATYDQAGDVLGMQPGNGSPADAGRHIIEKLDIYLPELYEYSLLHKNKRYIQVGDLNQQQQRIRDIIQRLTTQKNALPENIVEMLSGIKNPKDANRGKTSDKGTESLYNAFNIFLDKYINFREKYHSDNNSPQSILFERNKKKQGIADTRNKRRMGINLLASRLARDLLRIFDILDRAAQMDLRPWSKHVSTTRENLKNQLFPIGTETPNPLKAFTRAYLSGDSLPNLKLNNLIHEALWDKRWGTEKKRATGEGASPAHADPLSPLSVFLSHGDDDDAEPLLENSGTSANEAASMSGMLASVQQSISLTHKAAVNELSTLPRQQESGKYDKQDEKDALFVQEIISTCKKLEPIVSALHAKIKATEPSDESLRDTPDRNSRKIADIGMMFDLHSPRLITASVNRIGRLAKGARARYTKGRGLTQEEKKAALQAGWIVKDKFQQTRANWLRTYQEVQPLMSACQHADALEQLLEVGKTEGLDPVLKATRDKWQATIKEEASKLDTWITSRMDVSIKDQRDALAQELKDILGLKAGVTQSDIMKAVFDEMNSVITELAVMEEKIKRIPAAVKKSEEHRKWLSKYITSLDRGLQGAGSALNNLISTLSGREPGSYSRSGMLAKGIASLYQEWKQEWLTMHPSIPPAIAERQYATEFETIIKGYLPLLSKKKDKDMGLLWQRVKTEMAHAADGTTLYPTSMAQLLSSQQSITEKIQTSAFRRLIRKSLYAAFGSVSFLPSLVALPVRIFIKGSVTAVMVTYAIRKGANAVKLGEGSVKLETGRYKEKAFEHLLISLGMGLMGPFSHGIAAVFMWEDISQGRSTDMAKRGVKEVLTELPYMGGWEAMKAGASAAVGKIQAVRLEKEIQRFLDGLKDEQKQKKNKAIPSATDELFRIINDDGELKPLARRLMATGNLPRIRMERSETGWSYYDRKTRTVMLREGATDQEKLHEIAHALSAHQLLYAQDDEVPKILKKEGRLEKLKAHRVLRRQVKRLDRLRKKARKAYKLAGGTNGSTLYYLGNLDEFVAGLYSGPSEFTHFLASIDDQGRSLLTQAIELLCLLLGLDPERDSALTRAMGLSETIMGTQLAEGEGSGEGRLYAWHFASPMNAFQESKIRNDRVEAVNQLRSRNNPKHPSQVRADGMPKNPAFDFDDWSPPQKPQAPVQGKWPSNFLSENRILKILQLPEAVLMDDFPDGKGFKLVLKNGRGDVIFEKIYYPRLAYKSSGRWKGDILSQIEYDMSLQDEYNRISVSHIHRYQYSNPVVVSGASNDKPNVFVTDEKSLVKSVDVQIVDEEKNRAGITTPEITRSPVKSAGSSSEGKLLSAEKQLDDILLLSAKDEGMDFTQADLDKEYLVTFNTLTNNNYGAANFIPPSSKLHTKKYKLRDILSGNLYRDEDFTLNSISSVYAVEEKRGLTQSVLKKIISRVKSKIEEKIENLKYSPDLKSSVIRSYEGAINKVLMGILSSDDKSDDVINLVNDYLSGRARIKSVSVNIPKESLSFTTGSTKHKIPGMVAIVSEVNDKLKILISIETMEHYIMMKGADGKYIMSYSIADAIEQSLSKKDADNIKPGYQTWRKWTLSHGNDTNVYHPKRLMNPLFYRAIDKLKSDLDYDTFTAKELTTKRLVSYGQAVLRGMSIIAGAVAAAGSGNVPAAALLVGVVAEMADIGLSVLKRDNADRGDEYNEAQADILLGSILFVVFSASDIRALLKIAVSRRNEFLAIAKKAKAFVDKIKHAPDAGENLSRGMSDINVRTDYSRQVLDEGLIEGTITETRHHELMAGVETSNPTPSSASSSVSSSSHPVPGSSGHQAGGSTSQTTSSGTGQLQSPVASSSTGPTPAPVARGIDEGRRPFITKNEVNEYGNTYGYRQYDNYRMYLTEGQDARPDRFMVSGHGNTIGTNTVACPQNTTINFYGEHGKLLDDKGLESRTMIPSARVRHNERGQPVTEVPIIEKKPKTADKVVGWREATLEERIKFTGTSQPGRYKDINLSYFEDDNPHRAIKTWKDEKVASLQNPAFVPATPRPGGLVVIGKNKKMKLSTLVEDFASVSSTGKAVVDVNACRGGVFRTLLGNRGTRGRPSRRYVERTNLGSLQSSSGQAASVNNPVNQKVQVVLPKSYRERTGIGMGMNPSTGREGRPLIMADDFSNTQSVIAQGGRAMLQGARNTKTLRKSVMYVGGEAVFAGGIAKLFLYLQEDSSPNDLKSTMTPASGTSDSEDNTQDPDTPRITVAEGAEKVRRIRERAISLREMLTTYDDDALASLRPIEIECFGKDDYLDVTDLNGIIDLLKAIEEDETGGSLRAFLAGELTTWELQHPVRAFTRLGRDNVLRFLNRVLR
ncbi:hypothetical protein P8971_23690 [Serratia marcescens]|uniref:putative adhesin n=1 Tax=Serratia marcescens TaxID=615 RepID=UPI003204713E